MARRHELIYALNAGGVDKEAIARVDLEKMRITGEHPVANWLPQAVGPMSLRPGLESLNTLANQSRLVPFIRNSATTALLAFSNLDMAIFDTDGVALAVANPGTTLTNGSLTSGGGGWTDVSDTGDGNDGTAVLHASGYVTMTATQLRAAALEQSVSVATADQTIVHTLRIIVTRGPVFFRIGSTSNGEDIFNEQQLFTGTHKLSFTPGSGVTTIYIRFRSEDAVARIVDECEFEHTKLGGAGSLTLPTPWATADLDFLSWDQSADVIFVGDGTYQPRRIERRIATPDYTGTASWSVVLYETRNGPFQLTTTNKIEFTPNVYLGNGTLTSNIPYFKQSHVGGIFELTHAEQHAFGHFHANDQVTDEHLTIRGLFSTTKTFDDRYFGYTIDFTTGSFVGTIALESSTDPLAEVWTTSETHLHSGGNINATYNDEQSNLLVHYRLRVIAYTSGYADVTMTQLAGSMTGLVKITSYTSATSVDYEVVKQLGSVNPTRTWRAPAWSDDLGWPRVPQFRDDRLHWFRGARNFASIVDDYDNFDDTIEGDSAPIERTVGSGAAEGVRWAVDADRLVVGTSGFAAAIQASEFNEVITPTSYSVRPGPTLGAAFVPPVQIDDIVIMTDRSEKRLYDLFVPEGGAKLKSTDLSRLNPRVVRAGVKAMAVQRKPDTRVYIVLDDGGCVVMTYERDDEVLAFTTITGSHTSIDDVCVLPNDDQDRIYFVVTRNGTRYLERLASEADQEAVATCALLDGYKVLTGSISSITGATQHANTTVQVWADGQRRGDVAIDGSGNGTLDGTYSRVVYGSRHTASFLSAKLAYAAQAGTAVGQTKIVRGAGLQLSNSCLDGIRVGKDSSSTDPMPDYVDGAARTTNQLFSQYDEDIFPIQSDWNPDSRIYIEADSAEGPVTVQSVVLDIETRDGAGEQRGGSQRG